jgi:transcriptional regulator with XRE-family HTH domain
MSLGERIKEARRKIGMLQSDLADAVGGVTNKTISNWETGVTLPDVFMLGKIARTVDRPMEWFVQDELKERSGSNVQK